MHFWPGLALVNGLLLNFLLAKVMIFIVCAIRCLIQIQVWLPQIFFCAVKLLVNRFLNFRFFKARISLFYRQTSRITMPSKCYTVKRCRNYEIIKSRTWYILLSLRGLGHSGILSAVKLLRVSSDETVACDV